MACTFKDYSFWYWKFTNKTIQHQNLKYFYLYWKQRNILTSLYHVCFQKKMLWHITSKMILMTSINFNQVLMPMHNIFFLWNKEQPSQTYNQNTKTVLTF